MMSLFSPDALNFPPPRAFQERAHQALREGFRAGHKRQMLMAATGSGKTYLALRIIHEALQRGKRATFVCDRTTLIDQTASTAAHYGLTEYGIIQAANDKFNLSYPFQIASAQTLARRAWPESDVIVIDEAHTQHRAWTDHIVDCGAAVIGLSATPFSPGLGKMFTNLVNAASMDELTQSGVLVPMRVFTCTPTDMRGAEMANGEWTARAAEERGMDIVGDVVTEWFKFGERRKTICFGATIKHCEELCKQFNESGIQARVFTSKTSDHERTEILRDFRNPDSFIRVLISVEALAKGFDVPDVSCVIDCRPLRKSLSTAIQMWGRGLRASPDTRKVDCLLLDHSGNIIRFAQDYEEIFFNGLDSLNSGDKLDKKPREDNEEQRQRACPHCGHIPFVGHCTNCGYQTETAPHIEHLPGEMQEVLIGGRKAAENREHLWRQLISYARLHRTPDRAVKRAMALYKEITGGWPKRDWVHTETPSVEVTREVANKIRSLNIRYAKARERLAA